MRDDLVVGCIRVVQIEGYDYHTWSSYNPVLDILFEGDVTNGKKK